MMNTMISYYLSLILITAILNNAASIIVAHQHPSGDTKPSLEDINVTRRLVDAGKLLGIEVLDHLVVNSNNKFTSLKEKGYYFFRHRIPRLSHFFKVLILLI